MSTRRIRQAALIAVLALFAALPAAAEAKRIITISGSTSVFPLESKLARKFIHTKAGQKFGLKINQGGSNVGIGDVAAGRVTMGASSRDPAPGDPGGLVFTPIAHDAICLITNAANHLTNISQSTVQGVFITPTISSWSGVPGAGISGAIHPIGRAVTSGTHDAFRSIFLGGKNQGAFVSGQASNGLVQQGVKNDAQAIGYVSLAFTSGVNAVAYNGVSCDLRDAKTGAYPGVRTFYFVTQGAPTGGARKFINFTRTKKAKKIIGTEWVPLS